jgi:hypothetical protein
MPRLPTTINLSARSSFMPMVQWKYETHSCANYSVNDQSGFHDKYGPLLQTEPSIQKTFLAYND